MMGTSVGNREDGHWGRAQGLHTIVTYFALCHTGDAGVCSGLVLFGASARTGHALSTKSSFLFTSKFWFLTGGGGHRNSISMCPVLDRSFFPGI